MTNYFVDGTFFYNDMPKIFYKNRIYQYDFAAIINMNLNQIDHVVYYFFIMLFDIYNAHIKYKNKINIDDVMNRIYCFYDDLNNILKKNVNLNIVFDKDIIKDFYEIILKDIVNNLSHKTYIQSIFMFGFIEILTYYNIPLTTNIIEYFHKKGIFRFRNEKLKVNEDDFLNEIILRCNSIHEF